MARGRNVGTGCTKYTIADGQYDGIWYDNSQVFVGDGLKTLEKYDDVAYLKWGGAWRIPTKEQIKELIRDCYWVWVGTYNGKLVNGFVVFKVRCDEDRGVVVSGMQNASGYDLSVDVHIFLPAAGSRGYYSGEIFSQCVGHYWSSTLGEYYSDIAYSLSFSQDRLFNNAFNRDAGMSVRPVIP